MLLLLEKAAFKIPEQLTLQNSLILQGIHVRPLFCVSSHFLIFFPCQKSCKSPTSDGMIGRYFSKFGSNM